jgi:AcrR family transcriptional regulator
MSSRPYTLRRRAESQEATRRRILDATSELHRTTGPARTTISAIAEMAGVQRHTVYRHFPEEIDLFTACGQHFLAMHPPPNLDDWKRIEDPQKRSRKGLEELYSYFEANQDMIANVLRDSEVVPVGSGFRGLQAAAASALLPSQAADRRGTRLAAALRLATNFWTWQAFAPNSQLSASQAADLMCRMLSCL